MSYDSMNRARSACRLPKKMHPSKRIFEALGFKFEDTGDDVLYQATLPKGWTLKADGDGYLTYLIDEKGRERGSYFYKGAFYDFRGNMSLSQRFHITHDYVDPDDWDSPVKVFVKDAGTIIFEAGECVKAYSPEYDYLRAQARDYLDSKYPEWEDVTKYWD